MTSSRAFFAVLAALLLLPLRAGAQDEQSPAPDASPPASEASEAQPPEGPSAQPQAAEAQPAGSQPENLQAAQAAREHFMAGIGHFREHRYREAIRSFQLAAQLVPSADLWYNIARAHEELSEYDRAVEYYQRYLRDRVDPPDRAEVEQHIADLRQQAEAEREARRNAPTTGTLRLTANRDGANVTLDGQPAGQSPWSGPRELAAGRHSLSLSRDGYVPFRSEVSIEPGVTTAAYADLVPETRYRAVQGDRIFTWVAWGLAAAALGTSIGLGVEAASRQGTDLPSARTWAAYSDGALAGAIGLAVVGAILYFIEGRTVRTERVRVDEQGDRGLHGPTSSAH